jgi:hypothetical protein
MISSYDNSVHCTSIIRVSKVGNDDAVSPVLCNGTPKPKKLNFEPK